MKQAFQRTITALLLSLALAGCAFTTPANFGVLASKISRHKVDFSTLIAAAKRVQAAHLTEAEIRKAYPHTIVVADVPTVGMRYYITRQSTDSTQHVSLPGSDNLKDWLEDFEAYESYDARAGIHLHRGFEIAAEAVYANLKPHLNPKYKVQISGHSLGGAVAVILSIYLKNDGYDLARTITFGQPRITTAQGVARYGDMALLRVVDVNDPVPMTPVAPFEHFGAELILLDGNKYVFLQSASASTLSEGELARTLKHISVDEHELGKYLSRLELKRPTSQAVSFSEVDKF